MKHTYLITLLFALVLLAGCAEMNPHPMDMTQAVQNAGSKADHEALAKHYDEEANEMQLKVDEHKKILEQYQSKAYLYGRQAEDFKAHCQRLVTSYENAVDANRKMAEMHRALAQ